MDTFDKVGLGKKVFSHILNHVLLFKNQKGTITSLLRNSSTPLMQLLSSCNQFWKGNNECIQTTPIKSTCDFYITTLKIWEKGRPRILAMSNELHNFIFYLSLSFTMSYSLLPSFIPFSTSASLSPFLCPYLLPSLPYFSSCFPAFLPSLIPGCLPSFLPSSSSFWFLVFTLLPYILYGCFTSWSL